MRCAKCKTENPDGLKFCNECDTPFKTPCASCSFENAPAAKFCGQCGAALGAVAETGSAKKPDETQIRVAETPGAENPEGERKTVTALFADIKGSMELIEDLDPEEASAIVDPALKLMIDAVHHYGGYVAQSTGDGIFALFGAPIAHEDHPQRALFAAVRMQGEVKRYAEKLRADKGVNLQVRVGANAGEVVVREIRTGEKHTEYVPIGHSTSVAARLQALAAPGSIAITESMRKLVEGYFSLKPLGPARIKGVSAPVAVYEVIGLGPLRTRLQRSASRGLSKFVGREAEMEVLRSVLELAKTGHGQIVSAVGDPGVGKSRLFFEFKARSGNSCLVLETLSLPHGEVSAYLPVIELLRNYFEIQAEDDDRKRREKVGGKVLMLDRSLDDTLPHLFSLLGIAENTGGRVAALAPMIEVDRQNQRSRMLDAVKRLLVRESLAQPVIVEFEDLHWVDGETQELLNLLADSIASARILMLLNYRPEYTHNWGSKTYYTQLRLDPLGKESAEEMLMALLGADKELVALKRLIIDRTEGNPFFMEEIKEALFDQGVLARNGGVQLAKPISEIHLPPTVQGVLASRIDRLGREEKELLQTLAVIGKEFSLALVREVFREDTTLSRETTGEGNLARTLGHLQLAEFIYEQPAVSDVQYTFKHALTQEVAYRSVLSDRRAQLHGRIAAAIESLYSERLEEHYSELANHYTSAGESAKAVPYLYLAGKQASARSAYAEAFMLLTTGVELLKTLPEGAARDREELRMQLDLGSASSIVNGAAANGTEAAFSRAHELCRRGSESPDLVRALQGLATAHLFTGAVHKARETSRELLEVAERVRDPASVAIANSTLGLVLVFLAELVPARERLEQALALFESVPELPSLQGRPVLARVYLGRTLWLLGFPDQALKRTREAELAGQRSTDLQAKVFSLALTQDVQVWCGNLDTVREHLQTFLDAPWAKEWPGGIRFRTDILRGWLMAREGQPKGIAIIREAFASRATNLSGLYGSMYGALLADACASLGRIDEAVTVLDETLPLAETEQHYYEAELHRLRGELLLMRTDPDREGAEECFHRAMTTARSQSAKSWELRATTSLARLLANQGCRGEARLMLAEIYGWFTEGFDTGDLKDAKALLHELGG